MKRFIWGLGVASLVILASCSSRGEETAAEETAAQIEHARMRGREAARVFVNSVWKDTIQLQNQLLEARAKRSEFDSLPKSAAAFDSTFISTVRTVRPQIADELERNRPFSDAE